MNQTAKQTRREKIKETCATWGSCIVAVVFLPLAFIAWLTDPDVRLHSAMVMVAILAVAGGGVGWAIGWLIASVLPAEQGDGS